MQFSDQILNSIEIPFPPKKIISLVPSQTELLYDLGLENNKIGITKFCIHPKHLKKTKQIIGGTKNLNLEKIKQLKPDLIIANKEENEFAQIEELKKEFPVFVSDVNTLDSAFEMIRLIGLMTDTSNKAENLIHTINSSRAELSFTPLRSCIYLIWKDPYLTIGGDTFINAMLKEAGFENCYSSDLRYPETDFDQILAKSPDFLFLSSEPYPFNENHEQEFQKILTKTRVYCVDGEMFSWYGSRMQQAFQYFKTLQTLISPQI